jgi:nucleotide-binding universal stress UspA family protein
VESLCLTEFLADPAMADTNRKRVELHRDYGAVHQVICAAAERLDADLIVLGTHGQSGFVRAMIGSRAEELLRCVSVDTLMVRGDC